MNPKVFEVAEDELDDNELTRRTAAGETVAFGRLYVRHKGLATRVARRAVGNADDAEDVVAEAFTRMLFGLAQGRLSPDLPFVAYLLAVVRNAAVDRRRFLDRLDHDGHDPDLRIVPGADEALVVREEIERGLRALHALKPRWRVVLWLTEVEEVPAREVGVILGLSPNAAAQLARRARMGLRQRYHEMPAC